MIYLSSKSLTIYHQPSSQSPALAGHIILLTCRLLHCLFSRIYEVSKMGFFLNEIFLSLLVPTCNEPHYVPLSLACKLLGTIIRSSPQHPRANAWTTRSHAWILRTSTWISCVGHNPHDTFLRLVLSRSCCFISFFY